MKIPYFCCIGAELKRYAKDFDFMNQVYLYKVPTDDSIEEVLAEDYFKAISDSVLQDDILYIYEASAETLHSCRFDKQNGHITAIPLASDETLTGAVTTIIHDNLTKNRAVISNNDGKIAVSEVTSTELGYLHGATSNIQEQLNEKAKTDLSNLTSAGKNIANWSSNVTNCITEIPQDIKLELSSNGTLTLKAGAKVYVPNGAGVFNTVTTTADITANSPWGGGSDDIMLFVIGTSFSGIPATRCYSGASQPTVSGGTDAFWYDTANNVIKRTTDTGATWTATTYSLPIAIFSRASGTITAIKQVFKGLGYMGSIIFAVPGVKGLIPNGYNNDGTLKNTTFATSRVLVSSATTGTNTYSVRLGSNAISVGVFPYDVATNKNYNVTIAPGNERALANVGTMKVLANAIVLLCPKQAFHAVDYSDTEFIAQQSAPSDRYIDLSSTTITDGMTLTAPADGYYSLYKASSAAGQTIGLLNAVSGLAIRCYASNTGETLGVIIPVSKGQTITVRNNAGGNTTYFRFIYANGSK